MRAWKKHWKSLPPAVRVLRSQHVTITRFYDLDRHIYNIRTEQTTKEAPEVLRLALELKSSRFALAKFRFRCLVLWCGAYNARGHIEVGQYADEVLLNYIKGANKPSFESRGVGKSFIKHMWDRYIHPEDTHFKGVFGAVPPLLEAYKKVLARQRRKAAKVKELQALRIRLCTEHPEYLQ